MASAAVAVAVAAVAVAVAVAVLTHGCAEINCAGALEGSEKWHSTPKKSAKKRRETQKKARSTAKPP